MILSRLKARSFGVAWGIFLQDGSTVDLLPVVSQTIDWVRLPKPVSSAHSRDGHPSCALAHRANRLGRCSGRVERRATKSLLIREK